MRNVNKRCEYRKGNEKQIGYAGNLKEIHKGMFSGWGKGLQENGQIHILRAQYRHNTGTVDDVFFLYLDKEMCEFS